MLRIEVDVFSGRPNPVWMITDVDAADRLIGTLLEARGALARPRAGWDGLGYREVRVRRLADDEPPRRGVPREIALGSIAAADLAASGEIARRRVEEMPVDPEARLVEHGLTPLTAQLRETVLVWLERFLADPPRPAAPRPPRGGNPLRTTVNDAACRNCQYEISRFNPAFWNRSHVQPHNNCYNYARNWRTDTFAQPGRARGAQTSVMSCPTVTTAALADGLRRRCDCLPQTEYPRRHMALVVAPGVDYHWYREQRGGFWGHKPGSTAARDHDNAGAVIVSPETCDRGPYTDFCGYLYAGRSVVID
jgi:hypothetical protein